MTNRPRKLTAPEILRLWRLWDGDQRQDLGDLIAHLRNDGVPAQRIADAMGVDLRTVYARTRQECRQ